MKSDIKYEVFEHGDVIYPVDMNLLENITEQERQLFVEMGTSGHYRDGLVISKFLREDLSINLEKLELATILAVTALEANSPVNDITLNLRDLQGYYEKRGITENEARKREERTFLLGFISAAASEASQRDTLVVKFV